MTIRCFLLRRVSGSRMVAALILATFCGGGCALLAEPRGDENVVSIQLLDIPGTAPGGDAQAALAADDGFYIAGNTWTEESGSDLWLWRLDRAGAKLWEKSLAGREDRREEWEIVGLLPRRGGGVRAVVVRMGDTAIIDCKPDGDIAAEKPIRDFGTPLGILSLPEDHMLVFGTSTMGSHAWIARCNQFGAVVWKRSFDPGKDDCLLAATELKNGSIALVGQSGEYNKFGQGPSKLWLLRVSADGRKFREAFIKDARVFSTGPDMIAAIGNEVLVPFTRSQLPPICNVPLDEPLAFDARIARCDANLKQLWDRPAPPTSMPGATTLSAQLVSMAADEEGLLIRGLAEAAEEIWRARVTADASIFPVATLRRGEDIIAVCNYWSHTKAGETERNQLLLITVKPPQRLQK